MAKKILIRGAGDLASGIALRLHQCGFLVVMTEIEIPTTVRRTVAFSRAVYEKTALVEDIKGVLCDGLKQMEEVLNQGNIPVMIDEEGSSREFFQPDVLVDSILAKKNLGTKISDAKTVIGVGPGFCAGLDCHAVIESKRGHDLGRCIWEGSAAPNTGVPGMIGGYGAERMIRAEADGFFLGVSSIGTIVKKGDLLAYAGTIPILAKINGVVRGLLQDKVAVIKGMKVGDIDPRGDVSYCFTVSDKARAIGGGVLEAILKNKGVYTYS